MTSKENGFVFPLEALECQWSALREYVEKGVVFTARSKVSLLS